MDIIRKRISVSVLLLSVWILSNRITIVQTQAECFPMEVALVLPTSSNSQDLNTLKGFLGALLTPVDIGGPDATVQVAVIKYRGSAERAFGFGDYTTSEGILQAINDITEVSDPGNDVASALTLTNSLFQASGVRTSLPYIAIVFFDAASDNQAELYKQAELLNDFGITIIAVSITSAVDQNEIRTIVTEQSYVILSSAYSQLGEYTTPLRNLLCSIRKKLCPKQADIVITLDQSSSIATPPGGYDNWYVSILNFVGNITNAFPVSRDLTQFGIVKFSTNAEVAWPLNRYTNNADLLSAVKNDLHIAGGETNIAAAFRVSRTQVLYNSPGSRPVKKIMILVTDGSANRETESTFREVNLTKELGVEIFCIGITSNIDEQQLRDIASIPVDNHFFYARDFATVNTILAALYETTCAQPQYSSSTSTTTTTPTTTTTTTTITTTTTTPTTTTTTTTLPPTTLRDVGSCSPVDVIFVIDASGSLHPNQFPDILKFIIEVIESFPIESGVIQVGLVVFSTNQTLVVPLNGFRTYYGLKEAIESAEYIGGSSNKAGVFQFLLSTAFTAENGARDEAPRLAVLITNARSPDQASAVREADMARRAGVTILTVAIGDWLDINEIYAISSYPKSMFSLLSAMVNLTDLTDNVANLICSRTDPCLSSPCLNEATCNPLFGYYECKCHVGFGGQNCEKECKNSADVVIAVDSSGSIGTENWRLNTEFLTKVIQNMDLDSAMTEGATTGMRIALIVFNDVAVVRFNLNTYKSKTVLLQGLQGVYQAGSTNTAEAIRLSIEECFTPENGDRDAVKNYLIVVTDGRSNDTQQTAAEAIKARNKGISILAVGVGNYNYAELRSIASAPDTSNVLTVYNYSLITDELVERIDSIFCSAGNFCSSNPCQNGAECKNIMGGYSCEPCPPQFSGPHCDRGCSGYIDMVLMLDVSGSINYERFPMVKELIGDIIREFDIGSNTTRVGCIYFAEEALIAFNLSTYVSNQDVIQGIRDIPFLGGKTDISAALKLLHTSMFSSSSGSRSDAPRIVICITDAVATMNPEDTIPQAILVKNDMIEVIMVVVGSNDYVDITYAEAIVSSVDNIIQVSSYKLLPNVTDEIVKRTCNDVDECESSPCQNDARCINHLRRYSCICPLSFTGFNCEKSCGSRLDVVFVLDLSGSVIDLQSLSSLVRTVIYGLDTNNDQVRVGLVTYSTDVNNRFYLNTYTGNREYIINAIVFSRPSGATDTQAALRSVLQNQLIAVNGDRSGIPNVVVFISDGYSDVPEGSASDANAAADLKQSGATIYTIGIGDAPNIVELQAIASSPATQFVSILPSANSSGINEVAEQLLTKLCST